MKAKIKTIKMKYLLLFCSIVGLLLISCDPDPIEGVDEYRYVYMPQAKSNPNNHNVLFLDSAQSIIYGVAYGGFNPLPGEMKASFQAAPELIDSFLAVNGGSYELLPAEAYTFEQDEVSLAPGELASAPYVLQVNPVKGMTLGVDYVLPVRMDKVSGPVAVNPALNVTYYTVSATLQELDRSGWSIVHASSEEVEGEGPNNGHAIHAIDNNISTFWHTRWLGGNDPLPYILEIDMGSSQTLNGMTFVQRQGRAGTGGNAENIEIAVSSDGGGYTESGSFTLPNGDEKYLVYFENPVQARYLKVSVTSTYDDKTFTHMSEIGAF